jgi:hypothetical protein
LARYKVDLLGVQKVRRDSVGTVKAGGISFYVKNEKKIVYCKQDFLYTTEYYRQLRE